MYELQRNHIVCFDTNIIIWGIKKSTDPGKEILIRCAENLIDRCISLNVQIVIPSISLGEVLSGCESSDQSSLLSEIQREYIVADYDAMSAYIYANMWQNRERLKANVPEDILATVNRNKLKADFMIIATALANRAQCIYTSQGEVQLFRSFAQDSISIEPLPVPSSQAEILGNY